MQDVPSHKAASPTPASIIKHSVTIAGHATSISLESAFWDALKEIAEARTLSVAALIAEIDAARVESSPSRKNLSSAIRVYILRTVRK
ncbi:ribbon-helix-helix domain-containing protein [Beijerinckia indica]|uniref:Ribbon-helix-helix domain-containing protein n=1 Tax=Beijerinckia indica subsp. indica (strain ATCC 9039 / DSM 1715 / NCIMB 8712) TaxID=395963 RepID=B2IH09_BEII9|nr:ribbon-helix-helix domain-containing protein [Beijerinckia indica]ACB94423.1 conserved hypothetical protein [Beijerinckia indica subsp. indica ATCC 9039]